MSCLKRVQYFLDELHIAAAALPAVVAKKLDELRVAHLGLQFLHQLGLRHEQLRFKYQGRHFRLTDVYGKIVRGILA